MEIRRSPETSLKVVKGVRALFGSMRPFLKQKDESPSRSLGAKAVDAGPLGAGLEVSNNQKRWLLPWEPFLIGGLAFLLVTGGAVLRPGNLQWLMNGDHATYLLGWMFFRNTPLLQHPFGANWPYGMEMSSSIVYPDGVPLMAMVLKPFNALLPLHFQYFGIWILVCYLLQSFFAWKILDRLTNHVWHKVFGTLLFVFAPPFVFRLSPHFALGSHWLLLASLYLCFSPYLRSRSWILLVVLASLINPYLLAMTLLLFGAALVQHYSSGQMSIGEGLKAVALTGGILVFVMWEAGYFMVSTVGTGGFGFYRTSLLGFLDPNVGGLNWSHFLGKPPQMAGNGEGFCFLGIGTILLSIVAIGKILRGGAGSVKPSMLWPLVLVFCFSLLYALSNNVAIGPQVIFHYNVPSILERITSALRASGRFIWPAYYLLVTGVLAVILRGLGSRASLALIGFCVSLQVADSWDALSGIRSSYQTNFDRSANHPNLLNSSFWRRAAEKYKRIECVPPQNVPEPQNEPENYFPLCFFAATHDLPVNMAYLARVDERKFEAARVNLLHTVEHGQLDPQTLYVFERAALWASCALRMRDTAWAGVVDGYKIIAPAWDGGGKEELLSALDHGLPKYDLGARLSFAAGSEGSRFLATGWSQPEKWGVWSDGSDASILLWPGREPASDAELQLDAQGFVSAKCPEQQIEVSVNSTSVGQLTYSLQRPNGSQSVHVPRDLLVSRRGLIVVQFRFRNDASPARLGLSSDSRNLALGLKALVLKPEEPSIGLPPPPDAHNESERAE
jgi:hypothetical protein